MKNINIKSVEYGILGGALEVIYVVLVSFFFWGTEKLFTVAGVFTFVIFVLIFVFSTAVSAILILGYPFFLFLRKKYKEALYTMLISLLVIFILLIIGVGFYLLVY